MWEVVNGIKVKHDISGQKFYRLLAIKPVKEGGRNRSVAWRFLCDCGNVTIKTPDDVKRGHTKSCGCLYKETRGLNAKPEGYAAFYKVYYQYEKRSDGQFDFTEKTFKEITQQRCYYCGCEPSQVSHLSSGDYVYNGIDRLDSSKGYLLDNCVPCCGTCNIAKNSMSEDEFLSWIEKVYKYNFG